MVAGLRARVRLDQARLTDMLRGLDVASLGASHAATVAGMLSCIGDLATISFQPHVSGAPLYHHSIPPGKGTTLMSPGLIAPMTQLLQGLAAGCPCCDAPCLGTAAELVAVAREHPAGRSCMEILDRLAAC